MARALRGDGVDGGRPMTSVPQIHARIDEIATEIVRLQGELDREIFRRREALGWRLHEGLVEFEHGVVQEQRRLTLGVAAFLAGAPPATVLTAPVIYSLLDAFLVL